MLKKFSSSLLLFASGIFFYIISFAPYGFFPGAFIAFVPLLFLIGKRTVAFSFLIVLFFFLIVYLWQLSFVSEVVVLYGGGSRFFGVVALILLALFLALLNALTFLLWRLLACGIFFLTILFTLKEVLLEKIFSGFPWCLFGYTQCNNLWFVQWAAFGGVYLLTFLLLISNLLCYKFLDTGKKEPLIALIVSVVILHLGGAVIYHKELEREETEQVHRVGIIQPATFGYNFSSDEIFSELEKLLCQSKQLQQRGAELIVWPEYSLPITPAQQLFFLERFKQFARNHCPLLAGFNDERGEKIYNAAFLFSVNGYQLYYKQHLTPFGEYIPLRSYLFFARRIVDSMADFSPGEKASLLDFQGRKLGVAICYEIIFPSLVRKFVARGANLLITISNDSWFGRSQAPAQHLIMAVMRAVENRRYLIRSTTGGISAMITPAGRLTYRSSLFNREQALVKFSFRSEKSDYLRWGHRFPEVLVLLLFLLIFRQCRLKRKSLSETTTG